MYFPAPRFARSGALVRSEGGLLIVCRAAYRVLGMGHLHINLCVCLWEMLRAKYGTDPAERAAISGIFANVPEMCIVWCHTYYIL